jgi:hypothetical protein
LSIVTWWWSPRWGLIKSITIWYLETYFALSASDAYTSYLRNTIYVTNKPGRCFIWKSNSQVNIITGLCWWVCFWQYVNSVNITPRKKEFVNNPCPFYKNHHNGSIHFYIPFINSLLTECLLFYLLYFKMKNWNNQLHIYIFIDVHFVNSFFLQRLFYDLQGLE